MLEVLALEGEVGITGFISPISLTRSNRREILFFVNNRPVQDVSLTTALVQAYHTFLMVGRFPIAVLFLDMPPEIVDVNVHPTKAEVRFRETDRLFSGVQRAVRRALLAHNPVPQWGQGGVFPATQASPSSEQVTWEQMPSDSQSRILSPYPVSAPALPHPLPGGSPPILRLVGQIASAYLVAEGPDGLYLIDQHAAHERVLFEQMLAQRREHSSESLPSQHLLQPVTVELTSASARLLEESLPLLGKLGFQVESFGPGIYLVRAIPSLLMGLDAAAALRVLVEDFEEDETPLQAELEARIIARVCKRAAVKAGRVLSPSEQHALLADLQACQSPRTCPHGRPTMIHLSVDLLERQFGRRGAR
jgi:DNA mismatch repair protein MutL